MLYFAFMSDSKNVGKKERTNNNLSNKRIKQNIHNKIKKPEVIKSKNNDNYAENNSLKTMKTFYGINQNKRNVKFKSSIFSKNLLHNSLSYRLDIKEKYMNGAIGLINNANIYFLIKVDLFLNTVNYYQI